MRLPVEPVVTRMPTPASKKSSCVVKLSSTNSLNNNEIVMAESGWQRLVLPPYCEGSAKSSVAGHDRPSSVLCVSRDREAKNVGGAVSVTEIEGNSSFVL